MNKTKEMIFFFYYFNSTQLVWICSFGILLCLCVTSSTVTSQPLRLVPRYRYQQQQQQIQQPQQYPLNTYQQTRLTPQQKFEQQEYRVTELRGKSTQQQNIINKRQDLDDLNGGGLWGKRDNSFENTWDSNSKKDGNIVRQQPQHNQQQQQQPRQQQRFSNNNKIAVSEKEVVIRKLVKLRADVDEILAQHFNVIVEKQSTTKRQLLESAGLWG